MSHPASATPLLAPCPQRMPARLRGSNIAGALRGLLAAAGRQLRLRRDRRLLETLDDRALADLGLCRGGLDGAVRFGRGESFFQQIGPRY